MHVTLAVKFAEFNQEILAVHEQLSLGGFAESAEQFADLLLPLLAGFNLLEPDGGVFFRAGGEIFEAAFIFESVDALGAGLEVQPQWALDGDLVVAEIFVVKNFADDALALDGLVGDGVFLGEGSRLAVAEIAEDFGEFADMVGVFFRLLVRGVADAAAFVAEAFFHLHPELAGVNELHLALAGRGPPAPDSFRLVSTQR